jgi:hypothetical protein
MNTRIPLFVVCGLIAAASIPLILRWVRPNPIYGFRTPLTLSSPKIWYPANVFAGWALLIAATLSAAGLLLAPEYFLSITWAPLALFLTPLAIALVACFLYLRRFG